MTARYALALAANVGAVGVALTGSAWLWLRASESALPAAVGQTLPPVLEDVHVPFTPDPRAGAPFDHRVVVQVERVGAQAPARPSEGREVGRKRTTPTRRAVTTTLRPTPIKRLARPAAPVAPPPASPPPPAPPPPTPPPQPPPPQPPPAPPPPALSPPPPAPVVPGPPQAGDPDSDDEDAHSHSHSHKRKHSGGKKGKRPKRPPTAPPAPPPPVAPAPPVDPGDDDDDGDRSEHRHRKDNHERKGGKTGSPTTGGVEGDAAGSSPPREGRKRPRRS